MGLRVGPAEAGSVWFESPIISWSGLKSGLSVITALNSFEDSPNHLILLTSGMIRVIR